MSKSRSFSSADELDGDGGRGEGEDDAVEGSVLFDDLQDDTRALTSFACKRVIDDLQDDTVTRTSSARKRQGYDKGRAAASKVLSTRTDESDGAPLVLINFRGYLKKIDIQ